MGLVLGYVVGNLQTSTSGTKTPAPTPSAAVLPAGVPSVIETGSLCAVQVGRRLELGAEVVNQSSRPLELRQITPVLPLGGLRPDTSGWGPCSLLQGLSPKPLTILFPGGTSWLVVTFSVLVRCPQPLPVEFRVSYEQGGKLATVRLDSFPDLGQVRYSKCSTRS